MEQAQKLAGGLWTSRKFWIVALVVAVFESLALSGAVTFTPEQVLTFLERVLAFWIGAHTVSDMTSRIASASERNAIAKKGTPQ